MVTASSQHGYCSESQRQICNPFSPPQGRGIPGIPSENFICTPGGVIEVSLGVIGGVAGQDCGIEGGVTALQGNYVLLCWGLGLSRQWAVYEGAQAGEARLPSEPRCNSSGPGGSELVSTVSLGRSSNWTPDSAASGAAAKKRGQVSWAVEARITPARGWKEGGGSDRGLFLKRTGTQTLGIQNPSPDF